VLLYSDELFLHSGEALLPSGRGSPTFTQVLPYIIKERVRCQNTERPLTNFEVFLKCSFLF
jgi:hypothetical protein